MIYAQVPGYAAFQEIDLKEVEEAKLAYPKPDAEEREFPKVG